MGASDLNTLGDSDFAQRPTSLRGHLAARQHGARRPGQLGLHWLDCPCRNRLEQPLQGCVSTFTAAPRRRKLDVRSEGGHQEWASAVRATTHTGSVGCRGTSNGGTTISSPSLLLGRSTFEPIWATRTVAKSAGESAWSPVRLNRPAGRVSQEGVAERRRVVRAENEPEMLIPVVGSRCGRPARSRTCCCSCRARPEVETSQA